MCAELLKEQASTSSRRRSGGGPFTQWIKDAPKEKWSILYDTGGRRYGIETTNHAECYNMVMRHVRGFPLVGIVEFIIYGCTRYFRERYQAAAVLLNDPGVIFCNRVTNYMKEKIEKAQYHRVVSMGTKDQRFEVSCKDRTGQGVRRQRVVQDCLITPEGKVFCRCKKPQLLHLPCSHVIAACSESGLDPGVFVSQYYRKETAVHTWGHEIYGIGSLGSFTTPNISPMYIPNPDARRGVGRRQTLRIRNGMDESEAGKKKKRCNLCGADGHTYKKCPKMQEDNAGAEVGPSGNPNDGLPPDFGARRV